MKKKLLLLLLPLLLPFFAIGYVAAQVGINIAPIIITNISGSLQEHAQLPFNLSSWTLIDGEWMDSDALFTSMDDPYMPATTQVRMLACFNDAAADETTACNNATTGDLTLPTAVNEVYEFALDNQAAHVWVNVDTAAVATWTVEWQYFNGSTHVAFSNVGDGTSEFETAGLNRVTWDFPTSGAWPKSTLHAIAGYWLRAEVTAVSSVTTPPTGSRAYYETGRWWTFASSIEPSEQRRFDLNLETDTTRSFHNYFPHTDGIITSDTAGLELGANEWVIELKGYIDATAPGSGADKKIIFKDAAFEVTIPAAGIIQVQIIEAP